MGDVKGMAPPLQEKVKMEVERRKKTMVGNARSRIPI